MKRASGTSRTPSGSRPGDEAASYWHRSLQPLQILIFLLPLIIAYELGLLWVLRDESGVVTITAHKALLSFFNSFGITDAASLHLAGAVIVVVLLMWHVLGRLPWRIDLKTAGVMAVESLIWAAPLLLIGQIVMQVAQELTPALQTDGSAAQLTELNLLSRILISVGAGLYEELAFRMVMIAAIHTLLVDVGSASHRVGAGVAVVVSAAAFAAYHLPITDASGAFSPARAFFYFLAGVYFGLLYALRGFGIVVGAHAAYDIVTVCLMPDATA